jgi:hypothetical protein
MKVPLYILSSAKKGITFGAAMQILFIADRYRVVI